MDTTIFPSLTEPGVSFFLNKSLKNSNTNKKIFNNTIINLALFLLFIIILGIFLIYKSRTKLTLAEKKRKKLINKKYILEKIRKLNINKEKEKQEMAANIPKFESNFVQLHKNFYNI